MQHRRRRAARPALVLVLVVGACLALQACVTTPPATAPAGTAGAATAQPPFGATPGASAPGAGASLANALRDGLDPADILADLGRLQEITDEHGGSRPAGSDGHDAAAAFVADELRAAGLTVELLPIEVPSFRQDAPSILAIAGPDASPVFEDLRDFKAMLFSASGDVTAGIFALDYNRTALPGDRNGLGCNDADWAGVPRGVILLLQPASCRRHDVVIKAQAAGVLAIVTAYAEWPRDGVLRPTLIEPTDIRIPVLGATKGVGDALADAAAAGRDVHLSVAATSETRRTVSVIGDTPGGDPNHVVMLGGHLDSVIDGPGMNDNGTGTMTILEIARELAALSSGGATPPPWKVRVAFWTAEEIGLYGSAAYVNGLGSSASAIQAYLNFDMLGSPNGLRLVYDAGGSSRQAEAAVVAALFSTALEAEGLAWQAALVGASDQLPFDQALITTGGLFSGANERKTAEQAAIFGGIADAPGDACYHLACDTLDNVDPLLLGQMTRVAAWVTGALASGEVDLTSP